MNDYISPGSAVQFEDYYLEGDALLDIVREYFSLIRRINNLTTKYPEIFSKAVPSSITCSPSNVLDIIEKVLENRE